MGIEHHKFQIAEDTLTHFSIKSDVFFVFKLRLGASRTRSVGWSVGCSVARSVCWLVGLSVLLGY